MVPLRLKLFARVLLLMIAVGTPATLGYGQSASEQFSLMISAPHAEVKSGDPAKIEVVLKNISTKPMNVDLIAKGDYSAETGFKIYVRDQKGDLAPETTWGREIRTEKTEKGEPIVITGRAPILRLPPRETYTYEILLNRLYDLHKSGKYTIQVTSWSSSNVIRSNTITMTIKEPEPVPDGK